MHWLCLTVTVRESGVVAERSTINAAAAGEAEETAGGEASGGEKSGESGAGQGATSGVAASGAEGAASGGRGRGRGRGSVNIFGVKGAKAAKKSGRRLRPGEIRVQKDVSELDGGDCAKANFPNPNDLMNFQVIVSPDDGYWKGYRYTFQFTVPDMYPHEPPKVKCLEKIYHPNIDLEGNVCLNILRADWKPVLDINAVIYGLIVLFVQPNADDPLNHGKYSALGGSFR
ncbi:Ubiquitin-conjugating enzyme family protein [Hondaea fermentalgiana]|uniref:Ubiquitin-conjugating enzyme family protein n=1 Tax=Hondaea fermentalgiana TaxID=2315210 RepID=A0A2R5GP70_9STRA|nr:Ubiquitin-conjugating enzyme family protein [Hondaea fermentalgiana]|eukprot:GBG32099.1 Ubiquitin-conjugating enzyme family protein [Hondaea fermentalgiana]